MTDSQRNSMKIALLAALQVCAILAQQPACTDSLVTDVLYSWLASWQGTLGEEGVAKPERLAMARETLRIYQEASPEGMALLAQRVHDLFVRLSPDRN